MIIPKTIMNPINPSNRSFSVGKYLEVDLSEVTSIFFDLDINAFKIGKS